MRTAPPLRHRMLALVFRHRALALAVVALVAGLVACMHDAPAPVETDGGTEPSPGMGQDIAADQACLACHTEIASRWQLPSSHGALLDCTQCHGTLATPGPGHSDSRACSDCHSQGLPPRQASCTACHNPHGTENAFLVRETLKVPGGSEVPVHFTTAEGASADGLVHAGVAGANPGTGVCEVCHTTTRYYLRSGQGEPHETGWCPRCHLHQNGFELGLP
jgi:predicted CXXCH cytochrome family protein